MQALFNFLVALLDVVTVRQVRGVKTDTWLSATETRGVRIDARPGIALGCAARIEVETGHARFSGWVFHDNEFRSHELAATKAVES